MRILLDRSKSRRPRTLGLLPAALLLLALLAAGGGASCGDGTEETPGQRVRVSLTRPTQPSQLTVFGPVHYGHEFGLDFKKEDFLVFQSHAIATQSVLANQTAILGGSLIACWLLRVLVSGLLFTGWTWHATPIPMATISTTAVTCGAGGTG